MLSSNLSFTSNLGYALVKIHYKREGEGDGGGGGGGGGCYPCDWSLSKKIMDIGHFRLYL